jgi:hypothetical protein
VRKPTHIALKRGCDARTHDKYRKEVFIRETKNFWVDTSGRKYRKPSGYNTGDWPMYCIIPQSILPLPTYTANLVKNDKMEGKDNDFSKQISLWDDGTIYHTVWGTTYFKDGYPTAPTRTVKIDISSIKPFQLPEA